MGVHIQNLILNPPSTSWLQIIVSGLIGIGIMLYKNKENKKRWLNEGALKRKNELEIGIRQKLLGIKSLFDWWDAESLLTGSETLINNIENDNLDNERIRQVLQACDYIKTKSQEHIIFEGKDQRTSRIKEEFNLKSLIDEYMLFDNEIKDLLNEYKNLQTSFAIEGEPILYSVLDSPTMPGHKNYIEIFESNKMHCVNLIKIANNYKAKTIQLIEIMAEKIKIKG